MTKQETTSVKPTVLALTVNNHPGVMSHVCGLFAGRAYNVEGILCMPVGDGRHSRIWLKVHEESRLDQVIKQLNKLVDVVHATDRTGEDIIQRELSLLKLHVEASARTDVLQLAHALGCDIVEVSEHAIVLQLTGDSDRLDSAYKVFEKYGVQEMIRTGKLLMARGEEITP